ncbi:hypothetical protein JP0114_10070 [Helicobacter pylori]
MYQVAICDPIHAKGIQILEAQKDIVLHDYSKCPKNELLEKLTLMDALITRSMTPITSDFLKPLTHLKSIVRAGVGVDNIDLESCSQKGIVVMNIPTANTIAAVELTMAHLINAVRSFPCANDQIKHQRLWKREDWYGTELKNKKLGIIGFGNIGSRVGIRAKAFEMEVLAYDPYIPSSKATDLGVIYIGNDIEGFLHVSEISWDKNVSHPDNYLSVGQEIDVKIIDIDPKNRHLRVSLKQLTNRPFDVFESKHQVGDVLEGKVATLTDFGAFLNLGGVDGLLHNHDAFWDKDKKCKDHYKIGDVIKVKILKINKKDRKISLSTKHLVTSPTEEFTQKHKTDSVIQGKVVSIKDFGVFINADGIDVLIKNEDLNPLKKDEIKIGQEITCVVVAIEKSNNKVRASVHRLERKKEKEELQAFNTSDDKMTLGDILKEKL